jgi:hypothetical protein
MLPSGFQYIEHAISRPAVLGSAAITSLCGQAGRRAHLHVGADGDLEEENNCADHCLLPFCPRTTVSFFTSFLLAAAGRQLAEIDNGSWRKRLLIPVFVLLWIRWNAPIGKK